MSTRRRISGGIDLFLWDAGQEATLDLSCNASTMRLILTCIFMHWHLRACMPGVTRQLYPFSRRSDIPLVRKSCGNWMHRLARHGTWCTENGVKRSVVPRRTIRNHDYRTTCFPAAAPGSMSSALAALKTDMAAKNIFASPHDCKRRRVSCRHRDTCTGCRVSSGSVRGRFRYSQPVGTL